MTGEGLNSPRIPGALRQTVHRSSGELRLRSAPHEAISAERLTLPKNLPQMRCRVDAHLLQDFDQGPGRQAKKSPAICRPGGSMAAANLREPKQLSLVPPVEWKIGQGQVLGI